MSELATWNLARFLAGATDADLNLIRQAWPDCPINGGDPRLALPAVKKWLEGQPNLALQVLRVDPSCSPQETRPQNIPRPRLLASVDPAEVRWLYYPYLPAGKLTLLEGDPGVGKSWVSSALAAAVSRGEPLIGSSSAPSPSNVLLLTAEDDLADTVRPRLEQMEADLNRIYGVDEALNLSDENGIDSLERLVQETSPALVVIDPIVAYLGGRVDMHKANQVRAVLAPIASLAAQYSTAVLIVRHLSKAGTGHVIYRGLGSIDFSAAARSILLAGINPDNPGERAVFHIKCNVGPLGHPLGYKIEDGRFYWTGRSEMTVAQVLGSGIGEEPSALEEAKEFLYSMLESEAQPVEKLVEEAKKIGISERTLRRAKDQLRVKAFRNGEPGRRGGGNWFWKLPSEEEINEDYD